MRVFRTYLQGILFIKEFPSTFSEATVAESTATVLWRRSAGTSRSAATTKRPLIRLLCPWEIYWKTFFCFFKYPVNKSRRPASKLYLFENVMNI